MSRSMSRLEVSVKFAIGDRSPGASNRHRSCLLIMPAAARALSLEDEQRE